MATKQLIIPTLNKQELITLDKGLMVVNPTIIELVTALEENAKESIKNELDVSIIKENKKKIKALIKDYNAFRLTTVKPFNKVKDDLMTISHRLSAIGFSFTEREKEMMEVEYAKVEHEIIAELKKLIESEQHVDINISDFVHFIAGKRSKTAYSLTKKDELRNGAMNEIKDVYLQRVAPLREAYAKQLEAEQKREEQERLQKVIEFETNSLSMQLRAICNVDKTNKGLLISSLTMLEELKGNIGMFPNINAIDTINSNIEATKENINTIETLERRQAEAEARRVEAEALKRAEQERQRKIEEEQELKRVEELKKDVKVISEYQTIKFDFESGQKTLLIVELDTMVTKLRKLYVEAQLKTSKSDIVSLGDEIKAYILAKKREIAAQKEIDRRQHKANILAEEERRAKLISKKETSYTVIKIETIALEMLSEYKIKFEVIG